MKQSRNHYDQAFKMMAVELHRNGKPFLEVAKDLGISADLIRRWNREYDRYQSGSFPGNGKKLVSESEKEIIELRKRLRDVEMERDILKKAVSIFSRGDRKNLGS
ncbi:MAG: transposase [Bacteroidia bacterium]|nr:transposase [Bacteroidia bacterium]